MGCNSRVVQLCRTKGANLWGRHEGSEEWLRHWTLGTVWVLNTCGRWSAAGMMCVSVCVMGAKPGLPE